MRVLTIVPLMILIWISTIEASLGGTTDLGSPRALAIPQSYFGMHFIDKSNAPGVQPGALAKGTFVVWQYIERSKGDFDWSNLDAWVSMAESLQIDIVYTFGWTPEWAAAQPESCTPTEMPGVKRCDSGPKDIASYDQFVTALVTRYKGRIQYYELWNEPEFARHISVQEMVLLTKHEHDIIRKIDPEAKIISPSFNAHEPRYGISYCVSGGTRDVDVISFHDYPNVKYNFPETIDLSYSGPSAMLSPLMTVFARCGFQSKPIWDSEGSWSGAKDLVMTMEQKASFVSRDLMLQWSNGVSRFYWYAWDHESIGRLIGTPAAAAYFETRKWMQGAVMSQACAPNGQQRTVWICGFTRGNGYRALAVWNTAAHGSYATPAVFTQYRDLTGKKHTIDTPTVPIGPEPILLENKDTIFEFNPPGAE